LDDLENPIPNVAFYVADILERSFQHSRCSVRVMQGCARTQTMCF
jgi:hypothetical protein